MTVSNANCVEASLSRSKSDKGPDKWMPPNADYHCQYVTDWKAIKLRWALDMSVKETETVNAMKQNCPQDRAASIRRWLATTFFL